MVSQQVETRVIGESSTAAVAIGSRQAIYELEALLSLIQYLPPKRAVPVGCSWCYVYYGLWSVELYLVVTT